VLLINSVGVGVTFTICMLAPPTFPVGRSTPPQPSMRVFDAN
jgi:hypothetical protein